MLIMKLHTSAHIFLFSILFATVPTLAVTGAQGETSNTVSVLLASESTRFKNALIDELESLFTQQGAKVVKTDHSRDSWNTINAAGFDAVFISNSGVNSKVRPWVEEWLKNNKNASATVLLHTTQTRDWAVSVEVDSVTSASTIRDVKKLAAEYHKRINDALKEQESAPTTGQ